MDTGNLALKCVAECAAKQTMFINIYEYILKTINIQITKYTPVTPGKPGTRESINHEHHSIFYIYKRLYTFI